MTPRERCGATGKLMFASKQEVRAAAAGADLRRRGVKRWHRCAFCLAWHLTRGAHNHGSGSSWTTA